jgi:hypothetical protein
MTGFWISHTEGVLWVQALTPREARFQAVRRGYQVTETIRPCGIPWDQLRKEIRHD